MEARTDESRRDVVRLVDARGDESRLVEVGASRSCTRLGQRTKSAVECSFLR